MPSPTAFKRAFGLERGAAFAGARVQAVHVGHETVKSYQSYRFPIELELVLADDDEAAGRGKKAAHKPEVLRALMKSTEKELVVNSAYGNPYACRLRWPLHQTGPAARSGRCSATATQPERCGIHNPRRSPRAVLLLRILCYCVLRRFFPFSTILPRRLRTTAAAGSVAAAAMQRTTTGREKQVWTSSLFCGGRGVASRLQQAGRSPLRAPPRQDEATSL